MLEQSRRFCRDYLPGHGAWYFWGLLFLTCNVAAIVSIPQFLDRVVGVLEESTVSNTFTDGARAEILHNAIIIIALGLALAVFRTLSRVVLFIPGRRIEARLRDDYFAAVTGLPAEKIAGYQIGDLIARGTNDVNTARVMLSMGVLHTVNASLLLALSLFFMLRISVPLTLAGLVAGPALLMFVKRRSKSMMNKQREVRHVLAELSEVIRETFRAHTVMAVYPVFERIFERFAKQNRIYCEENNSLIRLRSPLFVIMGHFTDVNQIILLLFGGWLILTGRGDFGVSELIVFSVYLGLVQEPMRSGGFIISLFQRGEVSLERLYELYDHAADVRRHRESRAVDSGTALKSMAVADAPLVEIRNLLYRYGEDDGFSLEIPHLTFEAGRRYGVFGAVGSGKSTLLSILGGVQPVDPDQVFYRGIDYADIDDEVLASRYSIALQESRLFGRSIRENIELVTQNPMFTSDDGRAVGGMLEFDAAYGVSQLSSDVEGFQDGLDSMLGENGLNLSGGQKQRLALMRALVKPHEVLMLDDIVSAVDHSTETRIIAGLLWRASGSDVNFCIPSDLGTAAM